MVTIAKLTAPICWGSAVIHSLVERGELSQCVYHDDSTIDITMTISINQPRRLSVGEAGGYSIEQFCMSIWMRICLYVTTLIKAKVHCMEKWVTLFFLLLFIPQLGSSLWSETMIPSHRGMTSVKWHINGSIPRWFTHTNMVAHPSTNRAQCKSTLLIKTNALPLILVTTTIL